MDEQNQWYIAYESANRRTSEAIDIAERTMKLYDAKYVECALLRDKLAEARREIETMKATIYDRFQREDA